MTLNTSLNAETVIGKSESISRGPDTSSNAVYPEFRKSMYALPTVVDKENVSLIKYNANRFQLRKNDTFLASLAIITLIFGNIEHYLYYENEDTSTSITNVIRVINLCLTVCIIWLILRHYDFRNQYLIYRKILVPQSGLFTTSALYWPLITEIWIMAVVSFPGVDATFEFGQFEGTVTYSLDGMIVAFQYVRLYTVIRLFKQFTPWTSWRVNFYMPKANEVDYIFAIKWYLKDSPFWFASGLLISCIIVCALVLLTFERPFLGDKLGNLYDCVWLTIITFTTIGYGEIFPQTYLGRGILVIACIYGTFLLSIVVVGMMESTELTKEELKAYNETMITWKIRPKMKKEAAMLVQRFFQLKRSRILNDPVSRRTYLLREFRKHLNRFKFNRNVRSPQDEADVRGVLDSYNDIEYKIERLRVRGQNFTHGVDNMVKGIEAFNQATQEVAEVLGKYKQSTIRVTNLAEGILNGSIAKVENLEEVTPSALSASRHEKSINDNRKKSTLLEKAQAYERADEILKARGSSRGSVLVSDAFAFDQFNDEIRKSTSKIPDMSHLQVENSIAEESECSSEDDKSFTASYISKSDQSRSNISLFSQGTAQAPHISILSPQNSVSEERIPTENSEEGNQSYMIAVQSPKNLESEEELQLAAGDEQGNFEAHSRENSEEVSQPFMITVQSPKNSESEEEPQWDAWEEQGNFAAYSRENSEDQLQNLDEQEVVKKGGKHARNNSEVEEGSNTSQILAVDMLVEADTKNEKLRIDS